jgi:hypothetical protein
MKIFRPRIPYKTVTPQFFAQLPFFPHSHCTVPLFNLSTDFVDPLRLIQTMCQGHEDAAPQEQPKVSSSTSSWQPQKKKKKKFQKLQLTPPPAESPRPTHEIVNTGSTKIANGVPYVDVPLPLYCLNTNIDSLSHIYDY